MQTAGDYAVSAFFFFLVALFVRDTASDHFCSKSRTACTLGFSQKCSSLSDAQISRPNLIVLLRATSYVRHGLPQNHVRKYIECGEEKTKCNFPLSSGVWTAAFAWQSALFALATIRPLDELLYASRPYHRSPLQGNPR